jgi:hypothetical protein
MSTSKLEVGHTQDGQNVVVKIKPDDDDEVSVTVPAFAIGSLATGLLGAAADCGRKTGQMTRLETKQLDPRKLGHVLAHEAAVAEDKARPEILVVVFAIGATELSIGIPRDISAQLGTSLLTLSADNSAAN